MAKARLQVFKEEEEMSQGLGQIVRKGKEPNKSPTVPTIFTWTTRDTQEHGNRDHNYSGHDNRCKVLEFTQWHVIQAYVKVTPKQCLFWRKWIRQKQPVFLELLTERIWSSENSEVWIHMHLYSMQQVWTQPINIE